MELAINQITPLIVREDDGKAMPAIVVATVEGDIHDIGKNLVVLMLRNYGFPVIDLGKDVPADVIVDAAIENDAKVIGLSALMTTTMMKMVDVVELVKEKNLLSAEPLSRRALPRRSMQTVIQRMRQNVFRL